MKTQEHFEQRGLFIWAERLSSQIPELNLLFAIPNGGHRIKAVAARMKAEGVKAGVPDVFLAVPRGKYHGMFIEMKIKPNRLTNTQAAWKEKLEAKNYKHIVAYSCSEAAIEILLYLYEGREKSKFDLEKLIGDMI